VWAERKIVER